MTLDDLIEELENARKEIGGESNVTISFQTRLDEKGNDKLICGDILDIVCFTNSSDKRVGIWAMEPQ